MNAVNRDMEILIRKVSRRGVRSEPVLDAMRAVDRNEFVSGSFSSRAYDDMALPILAGQTISQPTIVGLMTQALELTARHRVLEIGTGSGYQTMILSRIVRFVYSLERFRSLADEARARVVGTHKRQNVSILHRDGSLGLPEAAPFDRILVTAASEDVPPRLLEQLKEGGVMVLPLGRTGSIQRLVAVKRLPSGPDYNELGDVRFVPLLEGVRDE